MVLFRIIELTFLFSYFQELREGIRGMPLYFPFWTKYPWLLLVLCHFHCTSSKDKLSGETAKRNWFCMWEWSPDTARRSLQHNICSKVSFQLPPKTIYSPPPPKKMIICYVVYAWIKTLTNLCRRATNRVSPSGWIGAKISRIICMQAAVSQFLAPWTSGKQKYLPIQHDHWV